MIQDLSFGEHFPPQSVGIVGISSKDNPGTPGYSGLKLFRNLRTSGYQGRLYLINLRTKEIDGVRTFPNLMALPEALDLVVITVPASIVPKVLEDCITAKVRISASVFISSYFEKQRYGSSCYKIIVYRLKMKIKKYFIFAVIPCCNLLQCDVYFSKYRETIDFILLSCIMVLLL